MALTGTDLLAVYREATETSYKTSVTDLFAVAPSPAVPPLNSVLQTGNASNGIDIVVNNDINGSIPSITLAATTGDITAAGGLETGTTILCNGLAPGFKLTESDNGTSSEITLDTGVLQVNNIEGTSMVFQFAGSTVASLSSAGLFEATSIDGGVYGE
jgi:hypothetical protein